LTQTSSSSLVSVALLMAVAVDGFTMPSSFSAVGASRLQSAVSMRHARGSLAQGRAASTMMSLKPENMDHPPEVIVGSPLPRVYVYDHCPFCVRARAIFGIKNVKYEVRFMANDDIDTPTKLIGKKIAPILEIPTKDEVMGESMDIVKRIDEDPTMGPPVLKPATDRSDIKAWQKKHQELFRKLQRPRYVSTGLLPEFATRAGRDAFIKNHQLPPYEKPEWKSDALTMDQRYTKYDECMAETATLLPQANSAVQELEGLIFSAKHCSEGGLGYDDIDLFGRLRSLTIIKGLDLPTKTKGYLEYMSAKCDIPLYSGMAV